MRESRTLEYKENLSSNTFLKTISAYANYGEGKIIFGINDQGNVIGITDPVNGCLNLENKINDLSLIHIYMDMGNPLYLCKTPKQIMGNMGITVDLNAEISNTYDEFILEWMSDCYITLQWKYRLWSSEIIDIVKPEKLYKQYYPLHETSLTNAVTKIYEIYHLKDLYMHHSELLGN